MFFDQFFNGLRYIAYKFNYLKYVKGIDFDWNINLTVNENLGNYWNCIKGQLQLRWFSKELHLRKKLGISTIDDRGLEMLRTTHRKSKYISNIVNYDILANQRYIDRFGYITMDQRKENNRSDYISQILYLGEDLNKERNKKKEALRQSQS